MLSKKSKSNSIEPHTQIKNDGFENYESQINELKKELNEYKNKLYEEKDKNKILMKENNELKKQIEYLNLEIEGLNNVINLYGANIMLKNKLMQNDQMQNNNEINLEQNQKKNNMIIDFIINGFEYKNVKYSVECNNTDLFSNLEIKIYEHFPIFKYCETFFKIGSKRIIKSKTLIENNIKDKDEIKLFVVEQKKLNNE